MKYTQLTQTHEIHSTNENAPPIKHLIPMGSATYARRS